jgi:actin-related protein
MAAQMLCGDEVQSAVVDIGNAFSKFGDGGQELPRHVFRSDIGKLAKSEKYIISDSHLRHYLSNSAVEMSKPFENGKITIFSVKSKFTYHDNFQCMI